MEPQPLVLGGQSGTNRGSVGRSVGRSHPHEAPNARSGGGLEGWSSPVAVDCHIRHARGVCLCKGRDARGERRGHSMPLVTTLLSSSHEGKLESGAYFSRNLRSPVLHKHLVLGKGLRNHHTDIVRPMY
eukprot:388876-Pyramimonas_sp.AAC.3